MTAAQDSLPLHITISEKLREQIFDGHFLPRQQLPSEHQLMQQFEVSRITARRAISNLIGQGLVISHQGKGVFVKERGKVMRSLSNPLTFFDEDMDRQGVISSIHSLHFGCMEASYEVRQKLKLPKHQRDIYCKKNYSDRSNSCCCGHHLFSSGNWSGFCRKIAV